MNSNKINHEDLIMKKAMNVFAEDGIKFLGIAGKVNEVSQTELVVLKAKNLLMDYTFLMEDDTYVHIEFQTTDKKELDLRRFRSYEALLSFETSKEVTTYVVYSSNICNPITTMHSGINMYKIMPISMAQKNGDSVITLVEEKIKNNEIISKEELIALTFTPIMGGEISKEDRIIRAIRIIKKINSEYKYDIESMIYAFADKFLSRKDLQKVKEELVMTELGKMLMAEGESKGKAEGKAEGKAILLIKQLEKKFTYLPDEYIEKIKNLKDEQIEQIGIDIFEINSLDQLGKYF